MIIEVKPIYCNECTRRVISSKGLDVNRSSKSNQPEGPCLTVQVCSCETRYWTIVRVANQYVNQLIPVEKSETDKGLTCDEREDEC